MRLLRRLRAYRAIAPRGRRNRTDALRYLVRRPAVLAAIGGYETAAMVSNRVDLRLKALATLRASGIAGCPF
jgi:hypothetical protein